MGGRGAPDDMDGGGRGGRLPRSTTFLSAVLPSTQSLAAAAVLRAARAQQPGRACGCTARMEGFGVTWTPPFALEHHPPAAASLEAAQSSNKQSASKRVQKHTPVPLFPCPPSALPQRRKLFCMSSSMSYHQKTHAPAKIRRLTCYHQEPLQPDMQRVASGIHRSMPAPAPAAPRGEPSSPQKRASRAHA